MTDQLPAAAAAALRFEEKVLPGGLTLRLLPMPGYSAVHVVYATAFGSIHRGFEQAGKRVELPAGVAHFLEHKMFENADGQDAFTLYGQTGAGANAYTGFDRTSYIFTATRELERNLDILFSFVGHPYFTAQTVAKEQGIIAQEIGMYQDNPEMRCVFGLLESLYHSHPVRDDIAGTVESIGAITPELLYACTDAFYNPANMALCAAGSLSMGDLEAAVERAGLPAQKAPPTTRLFPGEAPGVARPRHTLAMPVAMPLFGLGFKEAPVAGDTTRTEVVCDMLGEVLCGETGTLYRRLYDEGLVQPDFSCEFGCHEGCLHFMITGESGKPELVRQAVLEEIARLRRHGVDAEQFATVKRMMYGESIADLDSVERVASLLSASHFHHRTPADELAAIAAVEAADLNDALQHMMREADSAFVVVQPEAADQ